MGLDSSIEEVGRGTFDVVVNDTVLFSRAKLGRYPAVGEILGLLRAKNF